MAGIVNVDRDRMGLRCPHVAAARGQVLDGNCLCAWHVRGRVEGHAVAVAHHHIDILIHLCPSGTGLIAIFHTIGDDIAVIAGAGNACPIGVS